MKNKYCYAVLSNKNGAMLKGGTHRLPIFWKKEVAKAVASFCVGYVVKPILLEILADFLADAELKNKK